MAVSVVQRAIAHNENRKNMSRHTGMNDDFGLIAATVFVGAVAVFLYCQYSSVILTWISTGR